MAHALVVVKPDTVVGWRRTGFHPVRRWQSRGRRLAEKDVSAEVKTRIRPRAVANESWGAPGIRGELLPLGIDEVATALKSPRQDPLAERLAGQLRRPCRDRASVLAGMHRRRDLTAYHWYSHESRAHLSLGKDAPEPRADQPPSMGEVVELSAVGGFHHR
jgi:hypothetical protein